MSRTVLDAIGDQIIRTTRQMTQLTEDANEYLGLGPEHTGTTKMLIELYVVSTGSEGHPLGFHQWLLTRMARLKGLMDEYGNSPAIFDRFLEAEKLS